MKIADEHVVSILADNKVGVLTRIITGVRREGCNIKSITAARTLDSNYSRITLNIECYDYLLNDVIDRIKTLNCVKSLAKFDKDKFVEREYVVFSVEHGCKASNKIIDKYKAKKVQENIYELTGDRDTVTNCVSELNDIASVDIARTGSIILKIPVGGENE
jgi:acetolactate synthase-1/3 small subunit